MTVRDACMKPLHSMHVSHSAKLTWRRFLRSGARQRLRGPPLVPRRSRPQAGRQKRAEGTVSQKQFEKRYISQFCRRRTRCMMLAGARCPPCCLLHHYPQLYITFSYSHSSPAHDDNRFWSKLSFLTAMTGRERCWWADAESVHA